MKGETVRKKASMDFGRGRSTFKECKIIFFWGGGVQKYVKIITPPSGPRKAKKGLSNFPQEKNNGFGTSFS